MPIASGNKKDVALTKFYGLRLPRHVFWQGKITIQAHFAGRLLPGHPVLEWGLHMAIWEYAPALGPLQLNGEILQGVKMASGAGTALRDKNAAGQTSAGMPEFTRQQLLPFGERGRLGLAKIERDARVISRIPGRLRNLGGPEGAFNRSEPGLDRPGMTSQKLIDIKVFELLRQLSYQAALARTFMPDEDKTPGAHPVVVFSNGLWQNSFGGGRLRSIFLEGQAPNSRGMLVQGLGWVAVL